MAFWIGLAALISVPVYLAVQARVAYAWAGGWRIAALLPLIGLGFALIGAFVGLQSLVASAPDQWAGAITIVFATLFVYSPYALAFLLILGVTRAIVNRRRASPENRGRMADLS
jgi:hypothetical protein